MVSKYRVLFLCRENAARSIIAEALLRELAGYRFDAFSAGAQPAAGVHPVALALLQSGIFRLGTVRPKSWLEFTGEWAPRMDVVIAMDECVEEYHAPVFPGAPPFIRWRFADPLAEGMTEAERIRSFERVFWQIVRRINLFITLPRFASREPVPLTTIKTSAYEDGLKHCHVFGAPDHAGAVKR